MMEKWIRARYQPNLPLNGDRKVTASPEHIALSRQAAQEGMVLLKNQGDLLPLAPGSRVALFDKGSFDYVKGGDGSGDVTVAGGASSCIEACKYRSKQKNIFARNKRKNKRTVKAKYKK